MSDEQQPNMIVDPQTGDTERVEDVLDEIFGVLKKRGYVLAHGPNAIILGKVASVFGDKVRVLAELKLIGPDGYEWRPIKWPIPGKAS